MSRPVVLALLVGMLGCGARAVSAVPFHVVVERLAPTPRLALVAAPGARIAARVKPALELADGTVLRFDSPHRTADSAYFTDAPALEASVPAGVHRGVVRAGVCPAGGRVCRSVAVAVSF